jgi:hypothetical protein
MSGFLTICYVIRGFAYCNSTANTTIFIVLLKEMPSSSSSSWLSKYKKYMNSAVDLQFFMENFAVEIVNNVN